MDNARTLACRSILSRPESILTLGRNASVGKRELYLGLVGEITDLTLAEQWHRAHDHSAGLENSKPARGEHRRVRRSEQNPIPRNDAKVVHQHMRQSVSRFHQLPISPCTVGKAEHRLVASSRFDRLVEELGSGIQTFRMDELWNPSPIAYRP